MRRGRSWRGPSSAWSSRGSAPGGTCAGTPAFWNAPSSRAWPCTWKSSWRRPRPARSAGSPRSPSTASGCGAAAVLEAPAPDPQPLGAATVHAAFAAAAARAPEAIAVREPGRAVSYREVAERAGRLAGSLRARGIGPEDRIALLLEASSELAAGLLGILAAGATAVVLDPEESATALADAVAETRPRWLITGEPRAAGEARTLGVPILPRVPPISRYRTSLRISLRTPPPSSCSASARPAAAGGWCSATRTCCASSPASTGRPAAGRATPSPPSPARGPPAAWPSSSGPSPGAPRCPFPTRARARRGHAGRRRRSAPSASASSTSPATRRRRGADKLPPAPRGRELRRPPRLHRRLDARAPLPSASAASTPTPR